MKSANAGTFGSDRVDGARGERKAGDDRLSGNGAIARPGERQ